jgi:hypothetical protein
MDLTDSERRWIRRKWQLIRESQMLADRANNKWNQINDEINAYLELKGEKDIVQRAKIKRESIALKDALATGEWHSRNAERHIHDVNLFINLRKEGIL